MDEYTIKAIEDRGYDPSIIIALMEGIRNGYIFKAKETYHKPIIRVNNTKKVTRKEG